MSEYVVCHDCGVLIWLSMYVEENQRFKLGSTVQRGFLGKLNRVDEWGYLCVNCVNKRGREICSKVWKNYEIKKARGGK